MNREAALVGVQGLLESALFSLDTLPEGLAVETKGYLRQLIERLQPDRDLGAAFSSCAYEGSEVFARGAGWLPPLDEPPPKRWLQRLTAQPSEKQRREWRYVRVLVFDALPVEETEVRGSEA